MNYIVFFSKQANDEIKEILNSRAFYVGAANNLVYNTNTDVLDYVVKTIHRDSETKG